MAAKVRVLVVDDSAIARELIARGLGLDAGIEVVGKAGDAYAARDKIVFLKPDVITLDVEMPRMDGIEFLRKLMAQYPVPAVVVSGFTGEGSRRALEALDAGALEVVGKPRANEPEALRTMMADLAEKVKAAASADLSKFHETAAPRTRASRDRRGQRDSGNSVRAGEARVLAIGASTGGTQALRIVLRDWPADSPPTLVVQHMPPIFTRMFADSLAREARAKVREAEDGDLLERGLVLVAPGDRHMRLKRKGEGFQVVLDDSEKVSGHRPSVDVLFSSVAEAAGAGALGILLTGMGRDGADGMKRLRRAGARCLAQDEASSVVWGMPGEAWREGSAERLVPIERMAEEALALCLAEPEPGVAKA